jgi:peroxiredoxin
MITKNLTRLSPVFAAITLLSTAASAAQMETQVGPPLKPGALAPDFKTKTLSGQTLTLKSLRGKVVLVDFWATWCGPCRMSIPTIEAMHKRFSKQGLAVVGMSIDEQHTKDIIKPFMKDVGITYTITYAPQANYQTALNYHDNFDPNTGVVYDHPVPPAVYIIDRHGRVRWSTIGYYEGEGQDLSTEIKKLLVEK